MKIFDWLYDNTYLTKRLHYKILTNLHNELNKDFSLEKCNNVIFLLEEFKQKYPNTPLLELQIALENLLLTKKQILEFKNNYERKNNT